MSETTRFQRRVTEAGWTYAGTFGTAYGRKLPFDSLDIASAYMDGMEATHDALEAQLSASEAARERLIAATEQVIDAKNSRIRELEARVKQLTDAADRLFSLVHEKDEPLSSPANQALINAGDTIAVNEGNLWNLRWILMAHSPPPDAEPCSPLSDKADGGSTMDRGGEHG